jgi:CRP/FNR family transcriptional regulator
LLSRKDIADFAGISTESAVKILKTFEKESLISLDEKSVKVLNKPALEAISKNG